MSDEIEKALERDRTVEPSPWFRRAVMGKVRAEAELPPIAFPWKRVLAAIALAVIAMVASMESGPALPRLELLLPVIVTLAVASRFLVSARRI